MSRLPSAIALMLWVMAATPTLAETFSSTDPFLPQCRRANETRIPVPVWSDYLQSSRQVVQSLRLIVLAPQPDHRELIYLSFGLDKDEVTITDSPIAYSFVLPNQNGQASHDGLKVVLQGKANWNFGYVFSGFYEHDPKLDNANEITLKRVDTIDVVTSRR